MSVTDVERSSAPRLAVRGAAKSFGSLQALGGIDLELAAGEWVGLVGPNGAGKTTLMLSVAGVVGLDSGTVSLDRDGLGFVPQEVALYPSLTARENLAFFGALHGLRGAELDERSAWALGWAGLEARAQEPVEGFSGGMKRRLNIACGVLHRPSVVLLDEPTVGVDPHARQRIWTMLEELLADGAALLQSSHQLDEIESVCHRMVILDRGRVVAAGDRHELLAGTALSRRQLRLVVDRDPGSFRPSGTLEVEGREIHGVLREPAAELAALLEALRQANLGIEDLEIGAPPLEQVFTEILGEGLRE